MQISDEVRTKQEDELVDKLAIALAAIAREICAKESDSKTESANKFTNTADGSLPKISSEKSKD